MFIAAAMVSPNGTIVPLGVYVPADVPFVTVMLVDVGAGDDRTVNLPFKEVVVFPATVTASPLA